MTTQKDSDETFELADYYSMVNKNWLLASIVFILILGAVIAYTLTSPKIYQARSMVMITTQDQTSVLLDQPNTKIDLATQKEIILSRSVMGSVYSEVNDYFQVSVDPVANSNVIQITVESPNAFTAMSAANKIADSYVRYTLDTKKQDAVAVKSFIDEQIASYKADMDDINIQILGYKSKMKVRNLTTDEMFSYESLQQTLAAKDKLYNELLLRSEEVGISTQERSGNIKIIETASVPTSPVKPRVFINIILGVIVGMICSIGVVFLKYNLKKTYMNAKDVEEDMGPSVMGILPKLRPSDYAAPDPKKGFNLIFDYKQTSAFAEGIHALGNNVSMLIKEKNIKFLTVTSPEEGDGKSLVASNLAIELAHDGKKVLLVDANLRNPKLNKWFLVKKNEPGLSDVMESEAHINDVLKKTSYKNLYFLPAGGASYSRELSTSSKIQAVFTKLKNSNADVIIFDSPSLKHAESTVFSTNSQGVLIVIAPYKTNKEAALKNKVMLEKVKANVIGFVVNHFR
jgi:capsular exopolysaccharide synthesis family protein